MKIIAVDDERSNLDEIQELIDRTGLEVQLTLFTNPLDALDAALQEHFDAAFLDIQMPLMTGLELAERILNAQPDVETVFVTAYNHYATEAFELNAVDYILKPIREERFNRTLNKLMEKKKSFPGPEHTCHSPLIYTFGGLRLLYGSEEIRWNRPKSGELFSYLLMCRGRKVHKEIICEDLWPEFDIHRALANLQVTMSRLRKEVQCFGIKHIRIEYFDDSYYMQIGEAYYDAQVFEKCLHREEREMLEKAVSIYGGSYLEGKAWLWAEHEREKLRQKYQQAVEKLAGLYMDKQDFTRAENLLTDFISKEIPGENIASLFLKASALAGGRQKLNHAYEKIAEIYKTSLNMEVSAVLKREYAGLARQN